MGGPVQTSLHQPELVKTTAAYRENNINNTTLVSNFLQFDEEGNIVGLQGEESDLIHMYNKAESVRKRSSQESCRRRNVILLGDSLGDVGMAAGVRDPHLVLTIGFLNHNIEASLETYKAHFDIV